MCEGESKRSFSKPNYEGMYANTYFDSKCTDTGQFFQDFETVLFSVDPNRWYSELLKRIHDYHGTSKNEIERQIKSYVDEKLRMTTSSKNNNKLRTFLM